MAETTDTPRRGYGPNDNYYDTASSVSILLENASIERRNQIIAKHSKGCDADNKVQDKQTVPDFYQKLQQIKLTVLGGK